MEALRRVFCRYYICNTLHGVVTAKAVIGRLSLPWIRCTSAHEGGCLSNRSLVTFVNISRALLIFTLTSYRSSHISVWCQRALNLIFGYDQQQQQYSMMTLKKKKKVDKKRKYHKFQNWLKTIDSYLTCYLIPLHHTFRFSLYVFIAWQGVFTILSLIICARTWGGGILQNLMTCSVFHRDISSTPPLSWLCHTKVHFH